MVMGKHYACSDLLNAQQDRSNYVILKAENENLKNEGFRLEATLRSKSCPNCGGPAILGEMSFDEQHLRIENVKLKEEWCPRLRPCTFGVYSFLGFEQGLDFGSGKSVDITTKLFLLVYLDSRVGSCWCYYR
ncbi:hypothetical protein IFM89_008032 [Coptis chinensis]|uniref:Uncharacterized protein n=1 Tax=Coptis chinensis TaxID=261450 RepID=A0A835HWJ3_9MAGN|nr:hypothetical protein IFM89_008032 [Coptis chinensis]